MRKRNPIAETSRRCRFCGCTDERACPEGCSWLLPDVCDATECVERVYEALDAYEPEIREPRRPRRLS